MRGTLRLKKRTDKTDKIDEAEEKKRSMYPKRTKHQYPASFVSAATWQTKTEESFMGVLILWLIHCMSSCVSFVKYIYTLVISSFRVR